MRLLRIGEPGEERPALLEPDGRLLDAAGLGSDLGPDFFAAGGVDRARRLDRARLPVLAEIEGGDVSSLPFRVGPPIGRPGKIVCIGLNYRDHAAETGNPIPGEPVIFMKAPNCVVGPYDEILVPRGSAKTDWEVELAVVIGGTARYLDSPEAAAGVVAGYALADDVSERAFQNERGGQWVKGKSCETFNPLGPFLVTADELGDVQSLALRLWVNGELRQDGTTKDMIFGVHHVIWYLSQFMVLEPGDVINTGTPAGVAFGRPDAPYLKAGDRVELEGDGLGRQANAVGQA